MVGGNRPSAISKGGKGMNKFIRVLVSVFAVIILASCGSPSVEDVISTTQFEEALNNGDNMEGSVVEVKVDDFVPDSAFGYNIQTGQHLNFVSDSHPDVKVGDVVIVEVESVENVLGSYVISYKKIK